MSKLWIVHRNPPLRAALARATGLAASEITSGSPDPAAFRAAAAAAAPAAVILGLVADQADELAFFHALRPRLAAARWILLCGAGAGEGIRQAFGSEDVVVLEVPPSPQRLRAEIRTAFAQRRTAIDASRRGSQRSADRFDAWFGGLDVPGLALALEPALADLPLLLRGRPGSGRSLLGQHVERTHGRAGRALRFDARSLPDASALVARLAASSSASRSAGGAAIQTLWIDEIDALADVDQRALAAWITDDVPPAPLPADVAARPLRFVATAGPAGLEDRLLGELARAFVPRTIAVPPLERSRRELARLAERAARRWADEIGGPTRSFDDDALDAIGVEPWWGERAELEAVLRATLANARTVRIGAADLRFPDAPPAPSRDAAPVEPPSAAPPTASPRPPAAVSPASRSLAESAFPDLGDDPDLELDPEADPSTALTALSERWLADERATKPDLERSATAGTAAKAPTAAPDSSAAQQDRAAGADPSWRRLARSLAHEIRNPLVSIRTFTELLPEHYTDETFRTRFKELVGKDVAHIQDVVGRLAQAAARDRFASEPVDVTALVERLLADRRERIARGRLVVLSELERERPQALGDADALETALAGLFDRALDSLPERGDLFVSTHRLERAGDGRPRLRLLLRHHDPGSAGHGGELDPVSHILEYVLAETIVTALGGRLTIDPTQGPETLIVIDLPTP